MWGKGPLAVAVLLASMVLSSAPASAAERAVLAFPEETPKSLVSPDRFRDFLLELVPAVMKAAGHPVSIRYMPWARCLEEARQGRVDGAFAVFKNAERMKDFVFSEETLAEVEQSAFASRNLRPRLDPDLAWLAGLNIGVVNRTFHGDRLERAMRKGQLQQISDYDTLVNLLAAGRLDVAIGVRDAVAGAVIGQNLQGQIVELEPRIEVIPAHVAFTKTRDLTAIKEDFDRAMHAMKQDGRYQEIRSHHYPID
jgi:polar amino acid transport system substrate-binding protein